ncbi:MAG: hypothetical protein QOG50_3620 [Actinomycetota bacterium]|jgi:hypothetical protein|nr:hypothetical protein [Actinomycetota bacterium]
MPFASTKSAPNFELFAIITTAPVPVPVLVAGFALVFVVAAFEPDEPHAASTSSDIGSSANAAACRNLDDRPQADAVETRTDITTYRHAHTLHLRAHLC